MLDRIAVSVVFSAYVVLMIWIVFSDAWIARASGVPAARLSVEIAGLHGRIFDEDERGLAGVTVLASYGDGFRLERSTLTGDVGNFRVDDLIPGPVCLRLVGVPPNLTTGVHTIRVEARRANSAPVQIRLRRPVSITGTIVDEDAKPVSDCQVGFCVWPDWAVFPDASGAFELGGLSPDVDYDLQAGVFSTRWEVAERKGVRGGSKGVRIVMKRRAAKG